MIKIIIGGFMLLALICFGLAVMIESITDNGFIAAAKEAARLIACFIIFMAALIGAIKLIGKGINEI